MIKKEKLETIFFSHSAGPQYDEGKGSYDLVHYLKSELDDEFRLLFPKIEKPALPTYSKYKEMFASGFSEIKEPILLIGHSLGASTLLKYLSEEKPAIKILGLFLVSTPHWKSNMKEFQLKEDFQNALKRFPVFLYHSKNDPELPIENLEFYRSAFKSATVRVIEGKEHIFSKGLPELVSDLRTL